MSGLSERDLEALVGEVLAADREVPAPWREAARAAYSWRDVDRDLMALTYDSQLAAVPAVRGEGEPGRTLEFSGGGLTLEVELAGGRILGQLSAAVVGDVELEGADGSRRSAPTDGSGFFALAGTGEGPVRFAVHAGAARLVTEWVVV